MEERTSANSKGNNRVEVPEAREAQAGSVGGEMVRKMIRRQEEEMSGR